MPHAAKLSPEQQALLDHLATAETVPTAASASHLSTHVAAASTPVTVGTDAQGEVVSADAKLPDGSALHIDVSRFVDSKAKPTLTNCTVDVRVNGKAVFRHLRWITNPELIGVFATDYTATLKYSINLRYDERTRRAQVTGSSQPNKQAPATAFSGIVDMTTGASEQPVRLDLAAPFAGAELAWVDVFAGVFVDMRYAQDAAASSVLKGYEVAYPPARPIDVYYDLLDPNDPALAKFGGPSYPWALGLAGVGIASANELGNAGVVSGAIWGEAAAVFARYLPYPNVIAAGNPPPPKAFRSPAGELAYPQDKPRPKKEP